MVSIAVVAVGEEAVMENPVALLQYQRYMQGLRERRRTVDYCVYWTEEEMAYGLEDSGSKILLADQERVERFAACCGRNRALGRAAGISQRHCRRADRCLA